MSWLAVLKLVPWSEVISNAPKVADGARKLWNKMSNDGATSQSSSSDVITTMQGTGSPEARVQALESAMNELHAQMLASSELINALADQNAQLIKRMEAYRSWMRWLSVFAVAGMIAALVSLVMLLAR